MTAPERISISPTYNQKRDDDYYLVDRDAFPGKGTEYIRADIADARVAAAYEEARAVVDIYADFDQNYCCDGRECGCQGVTVHEMMKEGLKAPADAKAALEAVRREALKDAAKRLMQIHREHMADLERDPDNYVSAYYTASIELRALIDQELTE